MSVTCVLYAAGALYPPPRTATHYRANPTEDRHDVMHLRVVRQSMTYHPATQ